MDTYVTAVFMFNTCRVSLGKGRGKARREATWAVLSIDFFTKSLNICRGLGDSAEEGHNLRTTQLGSARNEEITSDGLTTTDEDPDDILIPEDIVFYF